MNIPEIKSPNSKLKEDARNLIANIKECVNTFEDINDKLKSKILILDNDFSDNYEIYQIFLMKKISSDSNNNHDSSDKVKKIYQKKPKKNKT